VSEEECVREGVCPRRSVSSSVYACMYGLTPPRSVSSSVSEEASSSVYACMYGLTPPRSVSSSVSEEASSSVYDCMYGFTPPRNVSSSVSEEECILKLLCLYVWFYSSSECGTTKNTASECIHKRVCLSVWFYSSSECGPTTNILVLCILKRVRGGVYAQAYMLVCMVLLLLGVYLQACPRRSVSSSVYACMYGITPPRTVGGVETQCRVIPKIKRQPLNEAGEERLCGAGIRCWALCFFFGPVRMVTPREPLHRAATL
jgi:hypothetical protein